MLVGYRFDCKSVCVGTSRFTSLMVLKVTSSKYLEVTRYKLWSLDGNSHPSSVYTDTRQDFDVFYAGDTWLYSCKVIVFPDYILSNSGLLFHCSQATNIFVWFHQTKSTLNHELYESMGVALRFLELAA